jgi:uncharacterized protein YqeY
VSDSIKARMEEDLKSALRSGDVTARETIRFTLAAIKNAEIEKRAPLDGQEELDVLRSQAKRRIDAIDQFRDAGRTDLVERETAQIEVLKRYLPAEMPDDELAALVSSLITRVGATGPRDMGKVMAAAKAEAGDRVSGKRLSDTVRQALATIS